MNKEYLQEITDTSTGLLGIYSPEMFLTNMKFALFLNKELFGHKMFYVYQKRYEVYMGAYDYIRVKYNPYMKNFNDGTEEATIEISSMYSMELFIPCKTSVRETLVEFVKRTAPDKIGRIFYDGYSTPQFNFQTNTLEEIFDKDTIVSSCVAWHEYRDFIFNKLNKVRRKVMYILGCEE